MNMRRFLLGAPWAALAVVVALLVVPHVKAAPDAQVTQPAPIIYQSGDVLIQRVRHEPDKTTCYLVLRQPAGVTMSCLRDSWVYFQDGVAGTTQALKGWVYFP